MAEEKKTSGLVKWGLIIGGIIVLILAVVAFAFVFFLPSMVPDAEGTVGIEPDIPEVIMRIGIVFVFFLVGLAIIIGIAFIIWELFFKKKELHIVQEHAKIVKEATLMNPVKTLGHLVMTGRGKIQHYPLGRIVGHTQVPVKFERLVLFDDNGKEKTESETVKKFEGRKLKARQEGRGVYDFFAFVTGRGVYGLPILNLLEPPKIFACYENERSPDLLGDVEIYDVGTWKFYGIYVPAQRAKEPAITLEDFKHQIMPIMVTSLMDYVGLVAHRGIEGDTGLQKWLEVKASQVSVKQDA